MTASFCSRNLRWKLVLRPRLVDALSGQTTDHHVPGLEASSFFLSLAISTVVVISQPHRILRLPEFVRPRMLSSAEATAAEAITRTLHS